MLKLSIEFYIDKQQTGLGMSHLFAEGCDAHLLFIFWVM